MFRNARRSRPMIYVNTWLIEASTSDATWRQRWPRRRKTLTISPRQRTCGHPLVLPTVTRHVKSAGKRFLPFSIPNLRGGAWRLQASKKNGWKTAMARRISCKLHPVKTLPHCLRINSLTSDGERSDYLKIPFRWEKSIYNIVRRRASRSCPAIENYAVHAEQCASFPIPSFPNGSTRFIAPASTSAWVVILTLFFIYFLH